MRNTISYDPRIKFHKPKEIVEAPIVIYVNDFDESAVKDFNEDMSDAHETGQNVIPIVIDSFGGSCYAINSMVSAILDSKIPVATILTGKAMSAGALLFGFGTEGYRFMDPYATIMIHEAGWRSSGKVQDIKSDALHLEDVNKSLYERFTKHLNQPKNYFSDLIASKKNADWFLTAREAKKHKIANHLKIPHLHTHVSVTTEFSW